MADPSKKTSNSGGNYKEEAYKIMMRSPRGLGLSPAEKKKTFRSVDMSPAEMAEILPQSTSESGLSNTTAPIGHHTHHLSVSSQLVTQVGSSPISGSGYTVGSTIRTTHHQKRVPWCFFERDDSSDVVGQLFSPSDFIVNNLFVEWKSSVARKLDSLDRASSDEKLAVEEIFKEDPAFEAMMESLVTVAKHCLPAITKTLLLWKATMANPANKKLTQHEERYQIAVEWIFSTTILILLKGAFAECPLDDVDCVQLEKLAFDSFKPPKPIIPEKFARKIPDQYALILGIISERRMAQIAHKVAEEIKANASSTSKTKLIPILLGIR
eukprot:TRINITY_DN8660_c0_g3_i2.p1 TRINITY_DN8660_c0_g3~~TRINITY_DN8660_c0_g3_i2.p1  ORF type:complete len:325 (-),score=76.14 TRINITY_DN8660_c0_g3_i2:74-1048(-)